MLRELDAIESDRDAVSWALGGTTALAGRAARALFRTTGGVIAGAAAGAGVFLICAGGLLQVVQGLVPGWRAGSAVSAEMLTAIAVPELIFVALAMALWRRRSAVAAGVVLAAITLMIHFVVHVASAQR